MGQTCRFREFAAVVFDRGLVWAEGDVHRRQRKAMTPAFGPSESKALMPCFLSVANKVCEDHRGPPTLLLSIANHLTLISRFIPHTVGRQVEGHNCERGLRRFAYPGHFGMDEQGNIRRVRDLLDQQLMEPLY
jgi:hypothetical protein